MYKINITLEQVLTTLLVLATITTITIDMIMSMGILTK